MKLYHVSHQTLSIIEKTAHNIFWQDDCASWRVKTKTPQEAQFFKIGKQVYKFVVVARF